jgi:hypothetical protein
MAKLPKPATLTATTLAVIVCVGCADERFVSAPNRDVSRQSLMSANWPNEPTGFTTISDYAFSDLIPTTTVLEPDQAVGGGWRIINNDLGLVTTKTDDATAPLTPDNVGQWRYPIAFPDAIAPGDMYRGLDASRTELYFGFWWKPSDPWEGHSSGINKILHLLTSDTDDLFVSMDETSPGTFRIAVTLSFPGICNQHLANSSGDICGARNLFGGTPVAVQLGQWHRVEVYVKMSTTSVTQDGIVRWWVNGTQVGNYTTANFNPLRPFVELKISPTWGGNTGEQKTEEDFFWFDHAYISVP